jgi:hypothetical protein
MAALAPNTATLVAGLVAIGIGHGLLYYSALYYAMRLERADIDAGGTHEALIGVGYVVGPGAALAGGMWNGAEGIVTVELIVLGLAMLLVGDGRGGRVLEWRDAERLPWGVLVLFGGGIALSMAAIRPKNSIS